MNSKQRRRLNQFYEEYKQAEARLQMAIQTFQGAQNDLQSKRVRFESAIEFVGGVGATWTFQPEEGVVVLEAGETPPEAEKQAQNGAPKLLPNRAARRAAKKALGT